MTENEHLSFIFFVLLRLVVVEVGRWQCRLNSLFSCFFLSVFVAVRNCVAEDGDRNWE